MQSTSDKVRAALPSDSRYWKHNGNTYHGIAPSLVRANSDSFTFTVTFNSSEPEYGTYYDHKTEKGGSLYDLAKLLGIEPNYEKVPAANSRKAKSLADYEADKCLPKGYLASKGWIQGTHNNRPCLFIPASDGTTQVRFLDTLEPRYIWKESRNDKPLPFYGGKTAIEISETNKLGFIVLVNGAGSVESAQYHGIPAFAVLGGEGAFNEQHAKNILEKYEGHIVIALDCDKKGELSTENIAKYLGDKAIPVNIGMGNKADIADFVKLWGKWSLERIQELARKAYQYRRPETSIEALDSVVAIIKGDREIEGRIIPMPFNLISCFGGNAKYFLPNQTTCVLGTSGGGKTAFWHSLIFKLLYHPRRFGFIVDAREFTPTFDTMRRIQMLETGKGLNYDMIIDHALAKQELKEGMLEFDLDGRIMKTQDIDRFNLVLKQMREEMQGTIVYANEFDYIEDTLDNMKRKTQEYRAKGNNIDMWIFDYLQMYHTRQNTSDRSDTPANTIAYMIKNTCREMNVHGLIISQTNKNPTKEQKLNNTRLTVADIAYAKDNHFNLILALNSYYAKEVVWDSATKGYQEIPDTAVKMKLKDNTYAACVEVLKNSHGDTYYRNIRYDGKNLQWLDETWDKSDIFGK